MTLMDAAFALGYQKGVTDARRAVEDLIQTVTEHGDDAAALEYLLTHALFAESGEHRPHGGTRRAAAGDGAHESPPFPDRPDPLLRHYPFDPEREDRELAAHESPTCTCGLLNRMYEHEHRPGCPAATESEPS